jgi:cobaltochelatase CobN
MHLMAAPQGSIVDDDRAIDLAQSPAETLFLSLADSELAGLARARSGQSLRLANLQSLKHPYSVDLYVERTAAFAKTIVVRLLGGRSYWPYGVDRLVETVRRTGAKLALLPGDKRADIELQQLSTLDAPTLERLHAYFDHGGPQNYANALAAFRDLANAPAPVPVPRAGRYAHPHARPGAPVAALVFYRAHYQAGDLAPVDALVESLAARGLDAHPFYV